MHLKKVRKLSTKNKITLTIISTIICTLLLFNLLKKEIIKMINTYVENDVKTMATYIINESIEESKSKVKINEIINTYKNSNNEITSIDYNFEIINDYLLQINKNILKRIKSINENDIELISSLYKVENVNNNLVYYVPYGIIKKNPLLTQIGPKIPMKVSFSSGVSSNIKTDVTSFRINNSLIKIYIEITMNYNLITPFISKNITLTHEMPLAIKLIEGTVPQMYGEIPLLRSNIISTNE